jgi:ribosome recycling factor
MDDVKSVMKDAKERMDKSILVYRDHLAHLRTGTASTGLLEGISINLYGVDQPLQQVANIMTPDARSILIQPYDKNAIPGIEKAILQSNLGLNPVNDGTAVRITIPPLTEERRKEIVKVVHKYAEECRQSVRSIRRDANDSIKKLEKDKTISEDEMHGHLDEIQKLTDDFVKQTDEIMEAKEQEVLEI